MFTRRSAIVRYVIACVLLVVLYVLMMPYHQEIRGVASNLSDSVRGGLPSYLEYNGDTKDQVESDPVESESKTSTEKTATEQDKEESKPDKAVITDRSTALKKHLDEVFDVYAQFWPDVAKLANYKNGVAAPAKALIEEQFVYSAEAMGEYLQVDDADLEILRASHAGVVKNLPAEYPAHLFNGTGVATVAGGRYMPVVVMAIKMLRKVSPHIPVEVFVQNKNEFEEGICETVLPEMNAKCMVLEDIYGKDLFEKFNIHGYQLKVLSMVASSFEQVLFLDSDSLPLFDVEPLFLREPFLSSGYIMWPDYWYRTTSPHFYDIAGVELGPRVRGDLSVTDPAEVPMSDLKGAIPDKSSESGQLVVDKRRHYKSLLLATFYNLKGFDVFYPLLSQGTQGEGDKETFIAAVTVLGDEVYQVQTGLRTAGRFDRETGFQGSGMLQADPFDDYMKHVVKAPGYEDFTPRVLFMHLNFPKLNPRELFVDTINGVFFKNDASRIRFYGLPSEQKQVYGFRDIELEMWSETQWLACDVSLDRGIVPQDFQRLDHNLTQLCVDVKAHVNWLERTHCM